MLKESQGNGMAKIKKLRHHLLVMATCLAMMLASTCFVLALPTRMFQQMGLLITKPYLLKKALMRHRTRTKMLQKIVKMRARLIRLQQLRLRIIRIQIVRLRQEQQPMMLVMTSYLHLLFLERGRANPVAGASITVLV